MELHIHHYHHYEDDAIHDLRRLILSTTQEVIAAIAAAQDNVKTHITTVGADVTAKVNALNQTIADLQAQLAAGQTLNMADFQPLIDQANALATSVDAIDPNSPAPTPVPTT